MLSDDVKELEKEVEDLEGKLEDKCKEVDKLEERLEAKDDEIVDLLDKLADQENFITIEELRDVLGLSWDARKDQILAELRRVKSIEQGLTTAQAFNRRIASGSMEAIG